MREAERQSGVSFGVAQQQYNDAVELPTDFPSRGDDGQSRNFTARRQDYDQYQQGVHGMNRRQGGDGGQWDSVSECYMLGGVDIRSVRWEGGNVSEMDAFVSEELYVHSKASLRALDRVRDG